MPKLKIPRLKLAWTVALAAAIIVLFNFLWLVPGVRTTSNLTSKVALGIAGSVRSSIDAQINQVKSSLTLAAEDIGIEPERTDIILERLMKFQPALRKVTLIDNSGRETFSIDRYNLLTDEDLSTSHSSTVIFQNARRGEVSIGETFFSPEGEPILNIAVPFRRVGHIEGILLANLNLRGLLDIVRGIPLYKGHSYVVDRGGVQIMHPDLTDFLRRPNFSDRAVVRKVIFDNKIADGLFPEDSYINESGVKTFTVGVPVPSLGFGVFVEQQRDVAMAPIRSMIFIALVTIALELLSFIVILLSNVALRAERLTIHKLLEEEDRAAIMLIRRDVELTSVNEKLLTLDEVKSNFISIVAHQLRTPISAIKWGLKLLLGGDFGPLNIEQQTTVQKIYASTERMIRLINDLLDVDRIESGRVSFNFGRASLRDIVGSVISSLYPLAAEKGLTIEFLGTDRSIPQVRAEADKLRTVVKNLLENAIRYTMKEGKISVEIDRRGDNVQFSVTDNGIGVPASQQERVFSRFFRGSNALRVAPDGSGLGLFTARNVIEHYGGRMWFNSVEGEGSAFYFTLPIAQDTQDSDN